MANEYARVRQILPDRAVEGRRVTGVLDLRTTSRHRVSARHATTFSKSQYILPLPVVKYFRNGPDDIIREFQKFSMISLVIQKHKE